MGNVWEARGGAGVCRMQRDGFAHWSATGNSKAILETIPLQLIGTRKQLHVNVKASVAHPVRLVVLRQNSSKPLGYKLITSDHVLFHVADLTKMASAVDKVVLCFELSGSARIYNSFYFADTTDVKKHSHMWSAN